MVIKSITTDKYLNNKNIHFCPCAEVQVRNVFSRCYMNKPFVVVVVIFRPNVSLSVHVCHPNSVSYTITAPDTVNWDKKHQLISCIFKLIVPLNDINALN